MLATRVRQKEGIFYFIAYKADALLDKVKFTSRYYFEGEEIAESRISEHDEVAKFISGIERSEKGFQRLLNRQKIKQIVNFYETVVGQPMIPGTVLLFTDETLRFQKMDGQESIGFLSEPKGKYLVIDGQHRLAGLHFFREKHGEQIDQVEVPCVLFDGRSGDFATEMFVVINSTHTRINRSHLVDLYEKVSWESPEKKFTAKVVNMLYEEGDSPLQYKINRLGGRSKQEKWILQSEIFNELLKVVTAHKRWMESHLDMKPHKCYALVRDYLKGVKEVMHGELGAERALHVHPRRHAQGIDACVGRHYRRPQAVQRVGRAAIAQAVRGPPSTLGENDQRIPLRRLLRTLPGEGQLERVRKIHQRLLDPLMKLG